MSTFYDNYVRLCALNNLSESGAAKKIGLSNAAASGWKKGKMPSATTQIKLADLFGVSVEELTQDTKKARPADGEALSDMQLEAIEFVKSLPEDELKRFLRLAKAAFEEDGK